MSGQAVAASNWRGLAEDLAEQLEAFIPERNCSCHLSPPCNDCVDHGYARELLDTIRVCAKREDEQGAKP